MKKCPKCNATFNDDTKFCTVCGTPLQTVDNLGGRSSVMRNVSRKGDLGLFEGYKLGLSQWSDFKGTATSKEYTKFTVFNWIVNIILSLITFRGWIGWSSSHNPSWGGFVLMTDILFLYMLITYVPSLAITSRYLHGNGSKGVILISIFQTVVLIPLLVFCLGEFIFD